MNRALDSDDELLAGAVVGAYVVRATLGEGGCARVYVAERGLDGARVAIKVLFRAFAGAPKMVARFLREIEAIQLVRHPGIVQVFGGGRLADGRPYYVMELLEGVCLDVLLRERGRLSPAEVLEIMEPLCAALHAVHQAGLVHRDIKGSNVFVEDAGGLRRVTLIDFGIAKVLDPEHAGDGFTTTGRLLGTPTAMAPEQITSGAIDARTDVYALGVLLFRLLTGQPPFRGETAFALEVAHLDTPAPCPSQLASVDHAVDAVVLRCLAKDAEKRYPGVLPLLDDLRRAISARAPGAGEPGETEMLAIAIHVEVRAGTGDGLEPDDDLLDDVGTLLDVAEQVLREARFELPVLTGSALLGIHLLPSSPSEAQRERQRAVDLTSRLQDDMSAHSRAYGRVEVLLCVHEGTARVERGPDGLRVAGGPLLRLASWVPAGRHGAFVTRELRAQLPGRAALNCLERYQPLTG